MQRAQLIEIHDQNWFPQILRDYVTDDLQMTMNIVDVYRPIAERLGALLRITGENRIIDLCSGAGGPWPRLHRALADQGQPVSDVCLTDKYPNVNAQLRAHLGAENISFLEEPVDALQIPANLTGVRTFFSSFHHFRPREAAAILHAAANQRRGIAIFEVPRRHILTMLLVLFVPIADLILVPFFQPFSWPRLIWTYLIPVVPLILLVDGIVSCLRTYSPRELADLAEGVHAKGYRWETGIEASRTLQLPITYLLGYPEAPCGRLPAIERTTENASTPVT